jgi:exopolysaccharide biosynthesis polyprenyl glycosylphosphotransferase
MADSKLMKKNNPWQLRLGERRVLLIAGDFLIAIIALSASLIFWGSTLRFIAFNLTFLRTRVPVWYYLLPFIWVLLLTELYDIHKAGDWKRTREGVFIAAMIGLGLYLVVYMIYVEPPRSVLPRLGVASFLILVVILTLLWRALYIKIFTAPQFMRRVLLVGGGKTGQIILQIINNLQPKPFHMLGIVDDDPDKQGVEIENYQVLGACDCLLDVIDEMSITDLIVAISGEMNGQMFQSLLDAQERGIEITRMPVAYEELLGRVPIRWLEADWILRSFVDETRSKGFYELWKRIMDLIGGLIGTLFFAILMPFISLMVLIDDGAPIFYSQVRSGRGGQSYSILKFRTMVREAEADGLPQWAQEKDVRATRTGRFLRKTHLDELPQFLNVLRGEMSLVGPRAERPELVRMFQKSVPFYRARLLVKPGLTGWAQVNQYYAASIDETITKLEYDLFYIKRRNIALDLIILLRTPAMVLGLRGR